MPSADREGPAVTGDDDVRPLPNAVDALQGLRGIGADRRRLPLREIALEGDRVAGDDVVQVALDEHAALLRTMARGVDHADAGTDLELVIVDDDRPGDLRIGSGMDVHLSLLVPAEVAGVVGMGMREDHGVDVLREHADLLERCADRGPHVRGARVHDDAPASGADERGCGVSLLQDAVIADEEPYAEDVEAYHILSEGRGRYNGWHTGAMGSVQRRVRPDR